MGARQAPRGCWVDGVEWWEAGQGPGPAQSVDALIMTEQCVLCAFVLAAPCMCSGLGSVCLCTQASHVMCALTVSSVSVLWVHTGC